MDKPKKKLPPAQGSERMLICDFVKWVPRYQINYTTLFKLETLTSFV